MFKHPGKIALAFLGVGLFIYFGFDIVSADLKTNSRKNKESESEIKSSELRRDEWKDLDANQKAERSKLKELLEAATSDSDKIEVLKKISSFWYALNKMEWAGDYAIKVAELSSTGEAWGIAGTTYLSGLIDQVVENAKQLCKERAIMALNKAIILEPSNPQHKMNLALCYVKMPGENPMEGILKLLELDKEYPDYIPVQIVLSQLAIKTGQWDKAYKRLSRVLLKDPGQLECNCLIIEVIQQGGIKDSTEKYKKFCK